MMPSRRMFSAGPTVAGLIPVNNIRNVAVVAHVDHG
jgi:translation elongation factor EF-G